MNDEKINQLVLPTEEELAAYYGRPSQFKELVYDLMLGALNLDEYPISASQYIPNEYEDGGTCDKLYDRMTEAQNRIYEKLGCEYDEDVEVMVDHCFDICRELCYKMYDYGAKYGSLTSEAQ